MLSLVGILPQQTKKPLHVVRENFFDSTNQHFLYRLISFGYEIYIAAFREDIFLLVERFFDNLINSNIIRCEIRIKWRIESYTSPASFTAFNATEKTTSTSNSAISKINDLIFIITGKIPYFLQFLTDVNIRLLNFWHRSYRSIDKLVALLFFLN